MSDDDNEKLRDRIMRESHEATPRYLRARRFASQAINLMQDYIPRDRKCLREIDDYLMRVAFQANVAIVNVPPEWDALNEAAIEKAMIERALAPLIIEK